MNLTTVVKINQVITRIEEIRDFLKKIGESGDLAVNVELQTVHDELNKCVSRLRKLKGHGISDQLMNLKLGS
ncbi:MAG: hypothetical protein ACM3X9_13490 [Bacillota bacterium]